MYTSSQRDGYLFLNIKNLLSRLKDNFIDVILIIFMCWFFYQVHLDGLNHVSDKFISLSNGWENLKSNKYMHEMINACSVAQNSANNF